MTHVSAREGYAPASIAKVIGHAGVSRPTFYEYFSDKEDCFLAVLQEAHERAAAQIGAALEDASPEQAAAAAADALIGFVEAAPAEGSVIVKEALVAGPRALDLRDRHIGEIARVIEGRYLTLAPSTLVPDISVAMFLGGAQRLVAARLRRGESDLQGLRCDLRDWVMSYRAPLEEHCWRSLERTSLPPAPTILVAPLAPAALPPGRPRLSREQVAENHRQRILLAAAEISEQKGYAATTVSEVSARAGVDSRVFHSLFADKSALFIAVHEMHFQRIMAVSASAFFTAESWPDRVWEAGRAFAGCIEESSTLARVSFIEGHAGTPVTQQRFEEVATAFTLFLQEGYQYGQREPRPSRLAQDAIFATIFEVIYRQTRAQAKPDITGVLPHVTQIALAPFLGVAEANRFIERKVAGAAGASRRGERDA